MTTLAEELPFAAAVETSFLTRACSSCFSDACLVRRCIGCCVVSYCTEECQKNDWSKHKHECTLLKSYNGPIPSAKVRIVSRILLKTQKQRAVKAFNGRTWASLMDHVDEVKNAHGPVQELFDADVKCIQKFMHPLKRTDVDTIEKALSKVNTNAFSTKDSETGNVTIGTSLYIGLSVHDHSCVPDCQFVCIGNKGILRSFNPNTVYSPELTISYFNFLTRPEFHRKSLKTSFFFDCTCPPCSDENHIFNQMGSSCAVTCCKNAAGIRNAGSSDPYKCNKCGKASTITPEQVANAQKEIEKVLPTHGCAIQLFPGLQLMQTCTQVLSQYNYHLIDLLDAIDAAACREGRMDVSKLMLEGTQPAYEYYLPEGHVARTRHLFAQTFHEFHSGVASETFMRKTYETAALTFGEEHSMTKRHKSLWERLANNPHRLRY